MQVRDVMNTKVVTFKPEVTLQKASVIFNNIHIHGAPVVDKEGKVIGLITK